MSGRITCESSPWRSIRRKAHQTQLEFAVEFPMNSSLAHIGGLNERFFLSPERFFQTILETTFMEFISGGTSPTVDHNGSVQTVFCDCLHFDLFIPKLLGRVEGDSHVRQLVPGSELFRWFAFGKSSSVLNSPARSWGLQ